MNKNKRKCLTPSAFSLMELSVTIIVLGILITGTIKGISLLSSSRLAAARSLTTNSPVSNIPNLALWLETTSKASFKLNNYGDNASLNSATWYDINPQELTPNNATAGTTTGPTYVTNGINNLPALKFNGTSQFMTITNPKIMNGTDYTVFVVEKITKASPNYDMILGPLVEACNSGSCFHFGYTSLNMMRLGHWANDTDADITTLSTYTADNQRIHSAFFSTARGKFYFLNGAFGTSNSTQLTAITNNPTMGIGTMPGTFYGGYIGEIIIFRRALRDQERWGVESYLAKKWGIAKTIQTSTS